MPLDFRPDVPRERLWTDGGPNDYGQPMPDEIHFWRSDGTHWIRVRGKACLLNSTEMKIFARDKINAGEREFALDLSECSLADDTFLGTMAGIAIRLSEVGGGTFRILGAPPAIREQLSWIGLDPLFVLEPSL